MGGCSAISYAYIGEFHNIFYRPKVVSWAACFVALGNMYLPGMAWLILPHSWSQKVPGLGIMFKPWRLLMIVYALPSILVSLLLLFLPESPRYFLGQGDNKQVLTVLKKMFVMNTGKKASTFPFTEAQLNLENKVAVSKKSGLLTSIWRQTKPLFETAYVVKTLLLCYLQYVSFLG